MTVGEYAFGIVWLVGLLAILAFGARRIIRGLCPGWSGPLVWLAEISTATAMLVVASELAGLLGGFTRPGLIVAAGALSAAAAIASRRISVPSLPVPPSPVQPRRLVALATIASLATAVVWAAPTLQSLDVGMYRQDSTWYHLTFSADFFQSGHVGGVHFTDPMSLAAWFYPQSSELLHGVGMVAFGGDFLSPLLNLGWMLLTLFAAWCVGRPFAAGPLAVLGVAIVLASNMLQPQAGNAPSDIPALFFLVVTIALLVNASAALGPPERSDFRPGLGLSAPGVLMLAALAAGLAVGTKITLLPAVATLTLALIVLSPPAERMRTAAIWAAGTFVSGSFWYLRNLVHAGNPLPWVDFGFLSTPNQIPLYPRPPHSVADYAFSPQAWTGWFFPGLEATLGPLWPLVVIAFVVGLVGALYSWDPLRRALGVVGIVSVLAYVLIPITAPGPDGQPYGFGSNLRYLAPAMVVGLLSLALSVASRRERAAGLPRKLVAAGLALTFLAVVSASDSWQLDTAWGSVPLALVLVLVPVAIAAMWLRGAPRLPLVLAVAAAFLGLAVPATPRTRPTPGTATEQRWRHPPTIPASGRPRSGGHCRNGRAGSAGSGSASPVRRGLSASTSSTETISRTVCSTSGSRGPTGRSARSRTASSGGGPSTPRGSPIY